MRTIDADALKELFSEVIGHIAKKPEMNGNLEHMIRASAMVIQMIDDAPTVQPDTTTHDSIPAETGENDDDRTTDDLISRQQAIMAIEQHRIAVLEGHKWDEGIEYGYTAAHRHIVDIVEQLPSAQPDTTTHGSIPAETGKNDGDGTSGDCISRQQAIDALLGITAMRNTIPLDSAIFNIKKLPSVQPEIIRCKDCKHSRFFDPCFYCYEMGGEIIVPENGFCFKAERREDATN